MAESELGDIRYPCAKLQLGRNSRKIIATLARCIFFLCIFLAHVWTFFSRLFYNGPAYLMLRLSLLELNLSSKAALYCRFAFFLSHEY